MGDTIAGGRKIAEIIRGRDIRQVCGYNYRVEFPQW
jgi:hypothetical protein